MNAPIRTLPLRAAIADGESVDSWLEALGRRHHISLRRMLIALGMSKPPVYTSGLVHSVAETHLRQIERATGLAARRLDAATADGLGAASSLRSGGSRFCPPCLAEGHGRWPLSWRINWAIACPGHNSLLLDACPACDTPPRRIISGGISPIPVATCPHIIKHTRRRCGFDLSAAPSIPVDSPILHVQRWIDQLVLDQHTPGEQDSNAVLGDLPVIVSWLLRHKTEHFHAAAAGLHPVRCFPRPTAYTLNTPIDAALTAVVLADAQAILGPDEDRAITMLRHIPSGLPTRTRIPPPGMASQWWSSLASPFPNRFLRAVDGELTSTDRLRLKTSTPGASRPGADISGRVRMVPQMLWPDWSARLLPAGGIFPDRLRAVASVCLLIPGATRHGAGTATAQLNPRIHRTAVATLLQAFAETPTGSFLHPVLTLLCRIAEHLDTIGSPIDYQRRRELLPTETIDWDHWQHLAFTAGAHPGDRPRMGRHLHAQRHLHQLVSGTDLSDPHHQLRFRSPADRSSYLVFAASLTSALRKSLREHATSLLSRLDINEPLSWSPPATLAEGLTLPGLEAGELNMRVIRKLVVNQNRPLSEVAQLLGVHIEHIRIALERLDRPQRRWRNSSAPLVWHRQQRAARELTAEFFQREYVQGGRRLDDLAETTGLSQPIIASYAKRAGITLVNGPPRRPIDPLWLREQYCTEQRSLTDIATETGVSPSTVALALHRLGIPRRAQGVHSRPEMTIALDAAIPLDIRSAVEGGLGGWNRLRRFQIAMMFPSLSSAATYLGADQKALIAQFRRLECDIGATLFDRSVYGKPQRPTQRGQDLLHDLELHHVRNLLNAAQSDSAGALKPQAELITDATNAFLTRRPPGPLIQFDAIDVQRVRITKPMLTVLQDVLNHEPQKFYGHEVQLRTGVDTGTLYPLLKRMERAGWLTSWLEDEQSWLAGAPPGRGPGRRRNYFALTPEGHRAALHELHRKALSPPQKAKTR